MANRVLSIILNFKNTQDSLDCIKSISCADKKEISDFIIIDHTSSKKNQKLFSKTKRLVSYLGSKNEGFAKGVNKGLSFGLENNYQYFLIINPDVKVKKNFFNLLNNFKNRVGIVAPAIEHYQNKIKMLGLDGRVNWQYAKAEHINLKKLKNKKVRNCQFVTFACAFLSRDLVCNVGLLDERYFMYCEDVDYCLSATKRGYKIILDPKVLIFHKTSSSFAKPMDKLFISFKSQIKFILKWQKGPSRLIPLLYNIFLYPYLYFLWSYHYYKNHAKNAK